MKWAARQLCAPTRYLRIRQGSGWLSSKATYDFVIPGIFAIVATFATWLFQFELGLFKDTGFIAGVINLLNLLIAFFIAALAAVATFDRPGLDDPMKGEPALMARRNSKGVVKDAILTHRQFICYLFGYLSFSSIMMLLALYTIRLIGPDAIQALNFDVTAGQVSIALRPIARLVGSAVFFLLFGQIVVTMLLGIYFLADRFQFLDDPED